MSPGTYPVLCGKFFVVTAWWSLCMWNSLLHFHFWIGLWIHVLNFLLNLKWMMFKQNICCKCKVFKNWISLLPSFETYFIVIDVISFLRFFYQNISHLCDCKIWTVCVFFTLNINISGKKHRFQLFKVKSNWCGCLFAVFIWEGEMNHKLESFYSCPLFCLSFWC